MIRPDVTTAIGDDSPKRVLINGRDVDVETLDVEVVLDSSTGEPVWLISLTFPERRVAPDCQYRGHEVTPDVRYIDGEVVGRCQHCDERITISGLPGGEPVVIARAMVDFVIGSSDDDVELLRNLLTVRARLEADHLAAQEALSLLQTAEMVLSRRILDL